MSALDFAVERRAKTSRPISPQILKGLVRLADLVIVMTCGLLVYWIYVYGEIGFDWPYVGAIGLTLFITAIVFAAFNCYSDERIFSKIPRIRKISMAWGAVASLLLLIAFGLKISDYYSRVWAVGWFGSTLVLFITSRIMLSAVVNRMAETGQLSQRAVIVGTGEIGRRLVQNMKVQNDPQVRIVGFIDDRKSRSPDAIEDYPVLGTLDDLVRLVRQEQIEEVFIALPWSAEERLKTILGQLAQLPINVRLAPDLIGFSFLDRRISQLSGVPMTHVFERPISGWSSLLKSAEDRLFAALFLVVGLPLMGLIALAIKLDSKGPVLFKQKRYGFNNKLINVYKFRTMYHHMRDDTCMVQTTKNDPRVTRVGRFLRKTSLDELPQMLNVLQGEMSIVGPRPHAVATKAEGYLFEEVVEQYAARHRVKPGITGWAQVNGWRGETDTIEKVRKRIEHDLYYIEKWSVMLDIWIMVRTVLMLFRDKQAY